MLTLNQIKKLLIDYFNAHRQIQDVKYCDDFDFAADRQLNYPVSNIQYRDSGISNRTINHNFHIKLADLINDNVHGIEDEIYSDMLLIAEDFFAWLANQNGFSFNRVTTLAKFVDANGDRVAGIDFIITLGVIRSQNTCIAPLND